MSARESDERPMLTIGETIGRVVRFNCEVCFGEGWVCEEHPMKPWEAGSRADCKCGAPGMPCPCTGLVTIVAVNP